ADPGGERGSPVEARLGVRCPESASGNEEGCGYRILDARPRERSFNAEHPLVDLIIEAGLTAADKAAIAIVAAIHAESDMTADVKAAPVIVRDWSRVRVGARWGGIGRAGRTRYRHHRRCDDGKLHERTQMHDIAPKTKGPRP